MSLKVVKGFSLQLNLNLKKSEEEESICLSIEENLPQLVVEQKTCQLIGQQPQGKAYLDLSKVCKSQLSQEYLYLIENLNKKNKFEKTMPVQFYCLENDQEKVKFLTQDQLVNNVILIKNSYEHNEESITVYDLSSISEIMQLFLNNFWIEFALMKENNQLISKLIFNNVTFVINKIDQSQNNLQILSNPVMQLLASKSKSKSKTSQQYINQKISEKDLSQLNNNTIRTGYLSMDSKQRIVPLLAQDEGVYKVPLIGIWIQSDENVNDIFLWTLFIEYAKNGAMKKCNLSNSSSNQNSQKTGSTIFSTIPNYSDISFLFVWFQSSDVTNPLFFQIQITQSSLNKCFQKAQLSSTSSLIKFDYRYSKFKPVNIIENGLNHTFEAQDQLLKPNKLQAAIPNLIKNNEENQQTEGKTKQGFKYQKDSKIFKQFSQKFELDESQNVFQYSQKEKQKVKEDDYKLKSSLINTSEDFFPIKDYNLQSQNNGLKDKSSLGDSYKTDNLKLSTRDLNISLNQSKQRDNKGLDTSQSQLKEQLASNKARSQSFNISKQTQQIARENVQVNQGEKYSNPQMQLLDSQKQILESKKILEERKYNQLSKKETTQDEKEKQLFYKSSSQQQNGQNSQRDLTSFQHNTLKQHQTLFEHNSKIEELEKQIQQLKKELQQSKSKDKYSPRVLDSGNTGRSEYSTVKKRSSKSVYSTNSVVEGIGSGGSIASGNTNSSKSGTKFVSRINQSQIQSPNVNAIVKSSVEKLGNNGQISSFSKNQRNLYSANSQATTATGNKSIDSRLLSQNQSNSFNMTNKSLNINKYLSGFSNNKDIDLTIGQLQSNEKPPIGCLSTARSNQLRSSIKNINQGLNTHRTSSSKQLQKQQGSSSSGSGANIKRCRFLECNDELPRIKFDFSNINDNEDSEDDSSNEYKNKSDKLLKYKLHSNINSSKSQTVKLNNFINF